MPVKNFNYIRFKAIFKDIYLGKNCLLEKINKKIDVFFVLSGKTVQNRLLASHAIDQTSVHKARKTANDVGRPPATARTT